MIEVLPGKLYQRGQFLTWPCRKKWAVLDKVGVSMVVNLWSKVDPDLSSETTGFVYLNWVCSPSEVPPNSQVLIDVVVGAMRAGHCVLIHCEAGRGRSVWLTGKVFAAYKSIAGSAALEQMALCGVRENLTAVLRKDLCL